MTHGTQRIHLPIGIVALRIGLKDIFLSRTVQRYATCLTLAANLSFPLGIPFVHAGAGPLEKIWDYDHPGKWGGKCKKGRNQSPIDIKGFYSSDLVPLILQIKKTQLHADNKHHTPHFHPDKGTTMKLDDRKYELVDFHFHWPSEHTVRGKHFQMEMHLVFKDPEGKVAVVAVMMAVDTLNRNENFGVLNAIFENAPEANEHVDIPEVKIDIADLLPNVFYSEKIEEIVHHNYEAPEYFRYNGSFTTPPCEEGVPWLILSKIRFISQTAYDRLKVLAGQHPTSRPVQPLNNREISAP